MTDGQTLLIVDNDRDLTRQLEFLLEDDFKQIFLGADKEAVLQFPIHTIDVFLLDVRLKEKDDADTGGFELAQEIRKKNKNAVIIMMSRYDTGQYESLADSGADCFIRKPFTMEEFITMVQKVQDGRNHSQGDG